MARPDKKEKTTKVEKVKTKSKNRKSPRGLKAKKVVNVLLDVVATPHKRHRNDHNHRMAQVTRLAKLLT